MPPPVDHETRLTGDHHQALRLWLRLLTCTTLIETEIRRRLREQFDTTLPRFDLMAQLERNPSGLRMQELSKRLMVTGGNVTTITDQLESEGMVAREMPPDDRRSYLIRLTALGRRRFAEMATTHEQWVIELFAHLPRSEKQVLHDTLGRLKRGLAADAPRSARKSNPHRRRLT